MPSSRVVRRACVLVVAAGAALTSGLVAAAADVEPQAVSSAVAVAATASGSGPAGLHPADIADAYGLSGGIEGGTVGIVIPFDTPTLESDLAVWRSTFGLPTCTTANGCFTKVDQNGGGSYPAADVGWSLEASLDVQSVSAACPACRILVVETANAGMTSLGTGVDTAVSLGADAVSMSWGTRENIDASYYSNRYFTHPGVPLVAATGDYGYPQAYMPATLPNVIAVGGTTLSRTTATGAARQAAAARDAVAVTNGEATAAAGRSTAEEHAVTLARAQSDLATATAAARTAAKQAASARTAVATQKRLLAAATKRYTAAAKHAKRSSSAAAKRTFASAKRAYVVRTAAFKKAAALVMTRTRAATAANAAVRIRTRSVAAAQAVVDTDRALLAAPVGSIPVTAPPVTVPVVTTVVSSPVAPPTRAETEATAPISPVLTQPGPTSEPVIPTPTTTAPVQTPDPAPSSTPTSAPPPPTATPTSAPTPTVAPNAAPTASFSATTTNLSAALDASSSADPDGTIAGYAWDFGDGSTGTGRTVTHAYAAAGTYTVTLTVTDDRGATASSTAPITAAAPTPVAVSAARGSWMETAWSGAGSGCSTYVDKPAWQTDTACTTRSVADVSAVGDYNTGLAVYDTYGTREAGYSRDGWMVVGGTSLAAPLIAGMIVRSGNAADYDDASRFYADRSAFWDVTSGSNGSCAGAAVCTAGVGYDGPTGLGTPKSLSSF